MKARDLAGMFPVEDPFEPVTDDLTAAVSPAPNSDQTLTAASERHVKGAMPALCHHDPLNYPCDAARFRDLADELAEALRQFSTQAVMTVAPMTAIDAARDALAKWEAYQSDK